MSLALPSYALGFARSGGESQHSELWDGLVRAYVPAFGRTGPALFDVGGAQAHGTFQNYASTVWIDSPIGKALTFNGVDEYVSCPTLAGLKRFTVVAYVNYTANGAQGMMGQGDASLTNATFFMRRAASSGFTTGGSTFHESSGPLPTAGIWSSVALVYDGVTLATYTDGVQNDSDPDTGTPDVPAGATSFSIGRPGLFNSQYWKGSIAYVLVWDLAQSIDRLQLLTVDPLAPFQLRRRVRFVPAVVGLSIPVAMAHYRRRRTG